MPINFFETLCKTISNHNKFGLCDDPSPAKNPAYIDETDDTKWIGIVDNTTNKEVEFYAIDNCVIIMRSITEKEKRCDGLLNYDNDLIFVELKDRLHRGWLGGGSKQLAKTIDIFKVNYTIGNFNKVEAYICNKQRPFVTSNHMIVKAKFKAQTGFILSVGQTIKV